MLIVCFNGALVKNEMTLKLINLYPWLNSSMGMACIELALLSE